LVHRIFPDGIYNDNLIKIDKRNNTNSIIECNSIFDLLEKCEKNNIHIGYKHSFFEQIVKNYREFRWVDIEYEYYIALVKLYKRLEKADVSRHGQIDKELESINNCFEAIKRKLEEYLYTIKIESNRKNTQIKGILFEETGIPETREKEWIEGVFNETNGVSKEEKLFVCFNYTRTMELYLKHSPYKNNLIYIHGTLGEPSNSIIFGYGDEMDPYYEKIENLNNNEFLNNIKSFSYFKTDNYQKVIRFIEDHGCEFTVKILGHSCGLSDRILLNTIFEHDNCKHIKIYYYQKSETENDYFEKTQEISRHFKASGKGNMRAKIVPFYESVPLVPFVTKS
jgi:hypothetical protein